MNDVFHSGLQAQVKITPATRALDPKDPARGKAKLSGAQAALYDCDKTPGMLMKVYHDQARFPGMDDKLTVLQMLLNGIDGVVQIDSLLYDHAGGECVGYSMKEVKGASFLEKHSHTNTLSRVSLALQLAKILFALQLKGCGPTDLHDKNILITPGGDPVVIDVDSFFFLERLYQGVKIEHHPQLGTVDFSAHELFGPSDIRHTLHSAAHSLAVNLYKILKDCHPGIYMNPSGVKLSYQASFDKDWYGRFTPPVQGLKVPDQGIPWAELPHSIQVLFTRTFTHGLTDPAQRPLPQEWVPALADWEKTLKRTGKVYATYHVGAACLLMGLAIGGFGQGMLRAGQWLLTGSDPPFVQPTPSRPSVPTPLMQQPVRPQFTTQTDYQRRDQAARNALAEAKKRAWRKKR